MSEGFEPSEAFVHESDSSLPPTGQFEDIPRIEHDFNHFDALDKLSSVRYFSYLQQRISDPQRYMDKGGAGTVFNINDTVCIKMMEDRYLLEELRAREEGRAPHQLNLGNRPVVEARIQERVADLAVAGVRAPHIAQYIPGKIWHGIVMERLNAVNIQHCLNGTANFPEGFQYGTFMDSLGAYLEEMHSKKHIYHGDLEPRNVMADIETGAPYLIDFGRSGTLHDTGRSRLTEGDWKKYDSLYEKLERA